MTISGISSAGKQKIIDCLIIDDLSGYVNKSDAYVPGYALTWSIYALKESGIGLSKTTEDKVGKSGADIIEIEEKLIAQLSANAKEKYEQYRDNGLTNVKSTEDLEVVIDKVNKDVSLSPQEKIIIADCLIIDDLSGYIDLNGSFIPGYALTWSIYALKESGIGLSKTTEDKVGKSGADIIEIEEELLKGLSETERVAYEELRDSLDRPNDQVDLMDALCKLDSKIGFCPAITQAADPSQIPANTPTDVTITGVNFPTDSTIEIVDQDNNLVKGCVTARYSDDTKTQLIAEITIPTAGNYSIKVSDPTGHLSAITPITVVAAELAEETEPTLDVQPANLTAGKATPLQIQLKNIDPKTIAGKTLIIKIGDNIIEKEIEIDDSFDGASIVLCSPGFNEIRVGIDDAGNYDVVVSVKDGDEIAKQTITVREPVKTEKVEADTSGRNAFQAFMHQYIRPEAKLQFAYQNELHNKNPLHQSVVEEQLNYYDIGLTINPRYQWGKDGHDNIAVGGTAEFAERSSGGEETLGLQLDGSIAGLYGSASANYVYEHHDLDTPSMSRPERSAHVVDTEFSAGYKSAFSILGVYRYSQRQFELKQAVFGETKTGGEVTHELGAEFAYKNTTFNGRLEGGFRFGQIDIFDSSDGTVSKDTKGWYLNGGIHVPAWWMSPYAKFAYLNQNNRGNETQQELEVSAGLNVGGFWIAKQNFISLTYSLKENNPYLPFRQDSIGVEWYMQNVLKLGAQYMHYEVAMPGHEKQEASAGLGYIDIGPGLKYLLTGPQEEENPLK